MAWADNYIKELRKGNAVRFRPRGNSMEGKISSGQRVTVIPLGEFEELTKGDIVLCKVKGNQFLHLIKAVDGTQYLIGNNKKRINGWINKNAIYGKCIRVE